MRNIIILVFLILTTLVFAHGGDNKTTETLRVRIMPTPVAPKANVIIDREQRLKNIENKFDRAIQLLEEHDKRISSR